jgi:hypothetical protein
MTWWSISSTEPTRKNRFLLKFGSVSENNVLSAKSVSKPKVNIETKEYRMINHYYSYPGIAKWDPITITLVDIGSFDQKFTFDKKTTDTDDDNNKKDQTSTANALWEMLLASGYSTPSGDTGGSQRAKSISSPEKASTIDNSFGKLLEIHQINSNGQTIEKWVLRNPIITKVSWGDLDYGDDGLVEYSIDVKYDWAVLEQLTNERATTFETDGNSE